MAALLCLAVAGMFALWQASRPDAALVARVDSLNDQSYLYRYIDPDTALQLARQAERLSVNYPDGRSEALNHQMFISFLHLDYKGCVRLYGLLENATGNQIELLAGDVNMMRICQQTSQNRLFFDYYNRASERIRRIHEESDDVQGRNRRRLFYAETEFHLVSAGNFLRMMQDQAAAEELACIDEDGYIRKDKALLVFYYYLRGLSCQRMTSEYGSHIAEAFDDLLLAYSIAERYDNVYFESLVGLSLAELLMHPDDCADAAFWRKEELDYLCNSFVTADSSSAGVPEALRFSEALAHDCLRAARRCWFPLVEIEAFRVLGDVMLAEDKYHQALNYYESALSCLNLHHRTYFPDDKERCLKPYDDSHEQSVDMLWTTDADIQTMPNSLLAIRERLSKAYSAVGDKQKSDYNRNIYLDLLDFTRQDKSLESRVNLVAQKNKLLNTLLASLLVLTLVLAVIVFFYARKWEKRRAMQQVLLNDIYNWFVDVAFTRSENPLEQALDAYPWMKHDSMLLRKVLRPYMEWIEKNRMLSESLKEEHVQLREDFLRSERQISIDKRKNIQKRARVSLVHSIMPFIDRILYTLRRMERTGECDASALEYVEELAEQIERYNKVLAEWGLLSRGEPELMVESFPLRELFCLQEKGRYGFQKKQVRLDILPTDLWVKADKALTFFMLNTLIDNARKFTSPGGRVTVTAQEVDNAVEIAVADTGCGLSEEDVNLILSSKIYDAGRIGASDSASGKEKGSGFGLLNCKGIIGKYRKSSELFSVCRFDIKSELGKGSRFSFRLPKGMVRTLSAFLISLVPVPEVNCQAALPADSLDSGLLTRAVLYADSAYFANIDGKYEQSMAMADSTLTYITRYYQPVLPAECTRRQLTVAGTGAEELEWFDLGVAADYQLIMGIRNELAVSALALRQWNVYDYNNNQFTHLYRLLTKDDAVEKLYGRQRAIQTNLSVSIALLVVVTFIFIILIYVIYFRRRILFRFNAMQVLEVNRAMLNVMNCYDDTEQTEGWMAQLLTVLQNGIRELHEVSGVSLLLYKRDGSRIGTFSQGQISHDLITDTLLTQAYEQSTVVYDQLSNSRFYALQLAVSEQEKVCIGALSVYYGAYRVQPEDLIFEGYIVTYLSILLYETVIRHEAYKDNVDVAENEKQRALYECSRLRVQNQILDNCLSSVKHESMYYPSRIRQVIRTMRKDMTDAERRERIMSLHDIAEFYREIYVLLCAQADRQVETGFFRCAQVPVRPAVEKWLRRQQQKQGDEVRLSAVYADQGDVCVNADEDLFVFMLELIGEEWMRLVVEHKREGVPELRLELSADDEFLCFSFSTPLHIYTSAECRELFLPDKSHYVYLLCKEIVREQDKLNNFCGCRMEAECVSETGCRIWFTLPKKR